MWYNKIVRDKISNKIVDFEKYFVEDTYELYGGISVDTLGNHICEFWSEE